MASFLNTEQPPPPTTIEVTGDDGKTKTKAPNPEFGVWYARDQQVFSYLLTTLPREMAVQVATCHTAAELWNTVQGMLTSHTRARSVNVRIALANLQKGNSTITEYVGKIRTLCDELVASGKKVDEEDVVSHILAGLEKEFDPVVSAMCSRVEPVTVPELYSQLLSFETRMNLHGGTSQSSANAASRGRFNNSNNKQNGNRGGGGDRGRVFNNNKQGDGGGDRGRNFNNKPNGAGGRGNPGGSGGGFNNNSAARPTCQICGKVGHVAWKCWKLYDSAYQEGEERSANIAAPQYGIDTNWYMDSGATDHITGDLEKLTVRERYTGNEQIHTANGSGMTINHVGHTTIYTPDRELHLNNVLHVPEATKSLISASKLALDNDTFVEIHPHFFLVKDLETKRVLLRGRGR